NTDIINTCIIFRSWYIHTHTQFDLSLLAMILLGVFYEYLRVVQRGLDRRVALGLSAAQVGKIRVPIGFEQTRERTDNSVFYRTPVPPVSRALCAAWYGATVFLSFLPMLVFMTYN
ncbi:hypothetical protein K443DRAFT_31102, partial [Laccaria amethystina LaAM-08-1]